MIFNINMALAIGLIALGLGGVLFLKAKSDKCFFAKIISFVVMIGSVLVLACTTYHALKFDKEDRRMHKRMNRMMGPPGGQNMKRFQMQQQGGMQNQQENFNNQNPQMDPTQLPPEEELEKEFEPGQGPENGD